MSNRAIWHKLGGVQYLAVIKNGRVIDIACSRCSSLALPLGESTYSCTAPTEVRVQDLALYTHWPRHTQEFWDLLNET